MTAAAAVRDIWDLARASHAVTCRTCAAPTGRPCTVDPSVHFLRLFGAWKRGLMTVAEYESATPHGRFHASTIVPPAYREPPGTAHCGPGECTCGATAGRAGHVTPAGAQ